ncbi:uncharacterized protein LOC123317682 [Coccinella septempunctata]|uniref:uncharacterized protein LOC123317682 n=1 Tax=Coccinella septempunctata TaxID=41139 RepID=UPI001D05FE2F|nr:uncharacterized protein LOC123317682 [Coccinella septempunctata]
MSPPETQDLLRARTTNAITNFLQSGWNQETLHHRLFMKSKYFLKDHEDIKITRADKGNVTVAISSAQYDEKMSRLINDDTVYRRILTDPTNKYQTSSNKFIKELKDNGWIDSPTATKLNNYKGTPPLIYGLPKIHKQDVPLRPIVSTLNSPTSNLSKFMADLLSTAFKENFSNYSMKNFYEFAQKVNNLQLPQNYVIVSLDVVSLYTNISWEITERIIRIHWARIASVTNIPQECFLRILKFLFDANYFVYKGQYFSQIFGCPMGSNLSAILAFIVMTELINVCLLSLPYEPTFLYLYVDDIIRAIPADGLQELLRVFNSYDEHIQFTVEEENENSVPFLDTRVIRAPDNTLRLKWYRKPTSSGRYIHYRSNHDLIGK